MKKHVTHIVCLILYAIALFVLNKGLDFTRPADYPDGLDYAKAVVTNVIEDEMGQDPDYSYIRIGKQTLEMRITSGEYKGKTIEVMNFVTRTNQTEGTVGTKYIVGSYDGYITTNIMSYNRTNVVVILAIAFLTMVIIYGGSKGISAVLALIVTLLNVIFLFMPMLINGVPAVIAAIIVVLISTFHAMVALNGFCAKSMIATGCCTLCTAFAGILAWIVGEIAEITTLNTPEVEELLFITERTHFRIDNLLIAGILIAAMGAVMDTSMSIVSSLYEIKMQSPFITAKELFKSGMNIGKDIMGTMTDTLILAFAGSSINLLVIYYMYQMPVISLMNTDFFVVEVMKGLIGSMAVVLSIPVTAAITSAVIEKRKEKRSL